MKACAFALVTVLGPMAGPALAAPKAVVVDALTGVALSGYDPVAYFTEGAPRQGSALYDHAWNGAVWYFASAANRDVFARAPEIYAPLFGGHCAMALSRGYLSDGNPNIFAMVGDRLMLFYSVGNREAFLRTSAPAIRAAGTHWDTMTTQPASVGLAQ